MGYVRFAFPGGPAFGEGFISGPVAFVIGDVAQRIGAIRKKTNKPICVGFGISNAKQAHSAGKSADGIIVGSALVRVIESQIEADASQKTLVAAATDFLATLRAGLDA